VTTRLNALRAQASALRAWANAIDAQIEDAEAKAAQEHTYASAPATGLALPEAIHARVRAGEQLQRCTKCNVLRTSQAPWRFRLQNGEWSTRKPPCRHFRAR
jgi:hypothetical protein